MRNHTANLIMQKETCQFQVSNFFKYYPLEYVQENIANLFEKIIPHATEHPSISPTYLFYEELRLVLKNCEFLYTYEAPNSIHAVVKFLKEVIPTSYIFCNCASALRTDLIIVMDQHQYKPFDEIHSLLDFAALGYKNINCTVYTYATIYEFLSKGHLYFSALCTPENCIYKKSQNSALPLLNPEKCNELIDRSTHVFNQNMQKALTFLNGARQLVKESEGTISGFMVQQACELTFRSLLLTLRGKQVKCHDLVVLRKHLNHFVPAIAGIFADDEESEIKLLTSIQAAYIRSRYDETYQINNNELEKSILATSKFIQNARQIFNYHCEKIKLLTCSTLNYL